MTNKDLIEKADLLLLKEDKFRKEISNIDKERDELYNSFLNEVKGKFFRIEDTNLILVLRVNEVYPDDHCFCTMFEVKTGIEKSITFKTDTFMNITVIRMIVMDNSREMSFDEVKKIHKKFLKLQSLF